MPSPHTIERQRGAKEASQKLGVLRERWPLAFQVRVQDVRPLALGTVGQIAEAMGWTIPYTIGVLTYWKMAPVSATLTPSTAAGGAEGERCTGSPVARAMATNTSSRSASSSSAAMRGGRSGHWERVIGH